MDDTLNTSQTSRPHRGRRPRRRKSRNRYCDDQKGDNIHVDDPSNSNSNTNNSLLDLDQLNIHTPNNVSANPQHSTPSFASTSTSQSELRIESYLTKQSNKKQEQVILRFKLTTEGTKLRLDVSENDKKMKPCTAPALDKYKKDVLMAVLAYYFNYNIDPNVKITKKKVHCLLCGCCGIPLGNTDELIAELKVEMVLPSKCDTMSGLFGSVALRLILLR
eukprot:221999_1